MTTRQQYGFDVSGFLHLPGLITAAEVAACNEAIDAAGDGERLPGWSTPLAEPLRALHQHPDLFAYLEELCGPDFALDQLPVPVAAGALGAGTLTAGDPERNRRLRYDTSWDSDPYPCRGVRIIWALAPTPQDGAIEVVAASHQRTMEPTAAFLAGQDELGMIETVALAPGDVLICAGTLVSGVPGRPGRLLEAEYISATTAPADGYPQIEPLEWTKELSAEQLAVVGDRTSGSRGRIASDGDTVRVTTTGEGAATVAFGLDADAIPDPYELWFWDVRGYLVVRGVMDADWLAAANRAIDAVVADQPNLPAGHPSAFEEVPEQLLRENNWTWPEDTSPRLFGEINRPRLGGLYELPAPYNEPFRRMIAHPAIVKRLNWILGYGYRETNEPMCCVYKEGTSGGSLHGQKSRAYSTLHGRHLVESVNVAWAIHDEAPGFGADSGGFLCVPGSHKGTYPIPGPRTTSIDMPQVYKPALQAGDVLLFGGVAHGTTAWRADWDRRTAIQFMTAGNVALPPGRREVGWRWSTDAGNAAQQHQLTTAEK
jgi:ectoine hydroxylase-related dioxygenase (phytanoyl-CoA dioxygenase family)